MKILKKLPLRQDVESKEVLRKLTTAHKALGELKGLVWNIPDSEIYINTLGLREAMDSTAIENVITTHDEVFKERLNPDGYTGDNAKAVRLNFLALKKGFSLIINSGSIAQEHIYTIHNKLDGTPDGESESTEIPIDNPHPDAINVPQSRQPATIKDLLANLVTYLNDQSISRFDPLVKMAIVHYQFENIRPFKNNNGRTCRIISLLYLIINDLLPLPVLYPSKYLFRFKHEYYKLLREVRETDQWEKWILFMLDCVEQMALDAIGKINNMQLLIAGYEAVIRQKYKFYSPELITNLFFHPYSKIEYLENELNVSRITAAKYLNLLAKDGFLKKASLGTSNYYINTKLMNILTEN